MTLQEVFKKHPEREKEFKEWFFDSYKPYDVTKTDFSIQKHYETHFLDSWFNSQVGWVIAWLRKKIGIIDNNMLGIFSDLKCDADNKPVFCKRLDELLTIMKQ